MQPSPRRRRRDPSSHAEQNSWIPNRLLLFSFPLLIPTPKTTSTFNFPFFCTFAFRGKFAATKSTNYSLLVVVKWRNGRVTRDCLLCACCAKWLTPLVVCMLCVWTGVCPANRPVHYRPCPWSSPHNNSDRVQLSRNCGKVLGFPANFLGTYLWHTYNNYNRHDSRRFFFFLVSFKLEQTLSVLVATAHLLAISLSLLIITTTRCMWVLLRWPVCASIIILLQLPTHRGRIPLKLIPSRSHHGQVKNFHVLNSFLTLALLALFPPTTCSDKWSLAVVRRKKGLNSRSSAEKEMQIL